MYIPVIIKLPLSHGLIPCHV